MKPWYVNVFSFKHELIEWKWFLVQVGTSLTGEAALVGWMFLISICLTKTKEVISMQHFQKTWLNSTELNRTTLCARHHPATSKIFIKCRTWLTVLVWKILILYAILENDPWKRSDNQKQLKFSVLSFLNLILEIVIYITTNVKIIPPLYNRYYARDKILFYLNSVRSCPFVEIRHKTSRKNDFVTI